ncbi:MAG TPA: (Fe-S)-binding protein [Dehalococcoidia bacterium]|nr:(Fe-S)-binding protein [Dehalococcoidia bacterium]
MALSPLDRVAAEVSKCNRCGFCQTACLVYQLTRRESSTARGHHYQIRSLLEGRLRPGPEVSRPLFECLQCRACVDQCFPRVQTDRVVAAGRQALGQRMGLPGMLPVAMRGLLLNPRRLERYATLLVLIKRLGLTRMAGGGGLARAAELLPPLAGQPLLRRIKGLTLGPAFPRAKVAYFVGCGSNYLYPEAGEATIKVLVAGGYEVELTRNYCCGLPAYSYGDMATARRLAKGNLRLLKPGDVEAIVTDCASCSSFLKSYPELLAGDPGFAGAAAVLAEKVLDITQFLARLRLDDSRTNEAVGREQEDGSDESEGANPPPPLGGQGRPPLRIAGKDWARGATKPSETGEGLRLPATVTYHDPCHASRYQGIRDEPRAILRSIPGVEYVEMEEADWCCGGAGLYSVMHPDLAQRILDRKMENVARTEAQVLVTSCPSCMAHLSYGVRRRGLSTRVLHLSQVVEMACGGPGGG